MTGITILGLGTGDPVLINPQVLDVIGSASEIYLRTEWHAFMVMLPGSIQIRTFDDLYQGRLSPKEIINTIVTQVINLGQRVNGVIYAVPGHPFVADASVAGILERAERENIPVKILGGISPVDSVLTVVGQSYSPQLMVVDALDLAKRHHPSFSPNSTLIVAHISSKFLFAEVKRSLLTEYPGNQPIQRVKLENRSPFGYTVQNIQLDDLNLGIQDGVLFHIVVSPLDESKSFEVFQDVVARLRAPDGCPWDREQTHKSLRSHLLSETYEVLDALDAGDKDMLREELGDLLLQIVLHAQIAIEDREFRMEDVISDIYTKLIRRHPHVFGDMDIHDSQGVLKNWEKIKAAERKESNSKKKGFLDGIPVSLPALVQAQEYQERANRAGLFPLPEIKMVFDKITAIINTIQIDETELGIQEIGDLLFLLTTLAIHGQIDIESALREANTRFRKQFS